MGPLLTGRGVTGGSGFLRGLLETVVVRPEVEGVRVSAESSVGFLETGAEVERVSVVVAYGLGAEAKFLKDGSDIRGAFQGKRLITIQLQLKYHQKV
jgi:hypothetical protein